VIKAFTKGISWKSSLEELISRGIPKSIAAETGLPVFSINLSNSEYLISLEKVQRDKSIGKQIYTFTIIDEDTSKVYPYSIEANRMTLGSDWDVYDQHRDKIAKIDGSKFNVGGKYTIEIDEKSPNFRKELDEILVLFSTLNRFLGDVEKKLNEMRKKLKNKEKEIVIERDEAMLYINPRRIKM